MDINETLSELTSLPVMDRLRVVESLWDSIESDTPVSISPEQREEINRRIEAHEANSDELLTWDQVLERWKSRGPINARYVEMIQGAFGSTVAN